MINLGKKYNRRIKPVKLQPIITRVPFKNISRDYQLNWFAEPKKNVKIEFEELETSAL